MAVIEFANLETETAFMNANKDTKADRLETLQQLPRKLYLLKRGQWSPYW
jgi:hypothetical protein